MSRIHVTIGELALKGFESGDRAAFLASFEKELSAVLADPATRAKWARSHRTPLLRLGQLPHQPGTQASRKLGAAIARGIGKGLTP